MTAPSSLNSPLPEPPMDAVHWVLEIDKQDIAYIVGLFEAYDDIAIVRTLDAARGRIELIIAPDYLEDARQVVDALKEEIPVSVVST
ncbi:MAG: DUF4911 domain-containing protein [Candidatus Nitronauta litoralis]|uniref:DUF4911 domain-containing protein n=1 Tax=Candidatus Nitronauta litoralis TaxID=2705533 RepID=A0A7T0BUJ0_9BACT|nr:MAG: DUF4911 domain-containing protein [Candidatus Nitronauta litoralis]